MINRRKKIVAGAGVAAIAATAILGGTLAQFTDRDTTATQTLQAGTVDVNVTEGANWDTKDLLLGIDDTVTRSVTLSNDGNLAISGLSLSTDVVDTTVARTAGADGVPGNADDVKSRKLSEGLDVTVLQDGAVKGQGKVSEGTLTISNLDLIAPGTSDVVEFRYTVAGDAAGTNVGDRDDFAANPDNAFQGSKTDVTFTVDAIQRPGVAQ